MVICVVQYTLRAYQYIYKAIMELCLRIVLLLSAVAITAVVGNSAGAPEDACSTITPGHGSSTATNQVPYIVNISSLDNGYIPGDTYTIVLSGSSQNADFAGFLIQGRMAADGTTRVGTFVANGGDQRTACSGRSATHTDSTQKTSVQLTWTAPPVGTGTILFRYAFVESFSVFWPNLATGEVSEVVAAATTTTIDIATTTTTSGVTTTATTTSVATASTSSVAPSPTTDVTAAPTTTTDAPTTADDTVSSSVVMSSATPTALPTDGTTTTSSVDVMTISSATPTVGATPAGGATGVMETSSVLLLLLASVIILIM